MRKIDRMAVLAASARRWGAARGLRSPDLQVYEFVVCPDTHKLRGGAA